MLFSVVVEETAGVFRAERAFLDTIGGGCTKPVAAYGEIDGQRMRMFSMAATPDGTKDCEVADRGGCERGGRAGT